jgi:hypothetical protein
MQPRVFIIGAMKSATTTLAELLARHPQIAVSHPKEPGYFSRDERFARGLQWYLDHFAHARHGQLLCDASTCYSRSQRYPLAASRLREFAPDAKLIYVLRNPVDRAYSHYVHEMEIRLTQGLPPVPLREFLETDAECVSASRYCREIEHLCGCFDRSQLMCLRFEEMSQAPQAVAQRIASFVGLDPDVAWGSIGSANAKGTNVKYHEVEQLSHRLRGLAVVRSAKALLPSAARRRLKSTLESALFSAGIGAARADQFLSTLEKLSPEVECWLHEQLDPDTEQLGKKLQWDVSDWLGGSSRKSGATSEASVVDSTGELDGETLPMTDCASSREREQLSI